MPQNLFQKRGKIDKTRSGKSNSLAERKRWKRAYEIAEQTRYQWRTSFFDGEELGETPARLSPPVPVLPITANRDYPVPRHPLTKTLQYSRSNNTETLYCFAFILRDNI